jgi:hypothetical protein
MSTHADRGSLRDRVVSSLARVVPGEFLSDGILAIEGTLARVKTESGYAERNQAWLDGLAARTKAGWFDQRQAMLDAAQRAEDMRNRVIGRLTK